MAEAKHTPGYEITRDGRVFSIASNWRGYGRREMRQTLNADGYPSVRLTFNGKRKRIAVHVLVAREYLPPRPSPTHEVRHLDGDKMNPSASNLAWGTRKENAEDRERHGRTSRGARHSAAIKASNQANGTRAFRRRAKGRNAPWRRDGPMGNKKSPRAKLDGLAARIEAAAEDVQAMLDALQQQIDDLEDKQAECETEARAAKLDTLSNRLIAIEDVLSELEAAKDSIETARDVFEEGWSND